MKTIILTVLIIFAILLATGRDDILRDIGSGIRHGIDSITTGYHGEVDGNKSILNRMGSETRRGVDAIKEGYNSEEDDIRK